VDPGEVTAKTSQAVDTICNDPPSATLDGFPAYKYCGNFDVWTDNGVDTRSTSGGSNWVKTEGGYGYQCVEWAVRYFYFEWNVPHTWFVGYAKDMCSTYPSGVTKTSSPVHGDLAVFTPGACGADATAGHVAAIESVGSSTISVVQQNPAGTYTWNKSCVMCYLHAASNESASDPCATAPSGGLYCGQSTQWGGGQKDVLYDCQGGVTASKTSCPNGCHVAPAGTNDSCNPPPDGGGAADAASHDGAPPDASPTSDDGAAPSADAGDHDGGGTSPPTGSSADAGDSPAGGNADASDGARSGCTTTRGATGQDASCAIAFGLVAMAASRRRRGSTDQLAR
jgi:hypothetical protein